jgi:hypothetical protein
VCSQPKGIGSHALNFWCAAKLHADADGLIEASDQLLGLRASFRDSLSQPECHKCARGGGSAIALNCFCTHVYRIKPRLTGSNCRAALAENYKRYKHADRDFGCLCGGPTNQCGVGKHTRNANL